MPEGPDLMPLWLIIVLVILAVIFVLWLLAKLGLFKAVGAIFEGIGDIASGFD